MIEVSREHLVLSDNYLRDAQGGAQSEHGLVDCAFEAGYLALLSVLAPAERSMAEHPNPAAALLAAKRLGIDGSQGVEMVRARYSLEGRPALADVLAWAEGVRARVQALEPT